MRLGLGLWLASGSAMVSADARGGRVVVLFLLESEVMVCERFRLKVM